MITKCAFAIALAATIVAVGACDGDGPAATPTAGIEATSTPVPSTLSPSATSNAASTPSGGAAIVIDQPAEGSTVPWYVHIDGRANVFEGRLTVEVIDPIMPQLRCRRSVTAEQRQSAAGPASFGPWSAQLPIALHTQIPRDLVTIRAFSISPRDGSEENEVARGVRLSGDRPNIVITLPPCNAASPNGGMLVVGGDALVFEAALTVELRDAEGRAIASQNALAASGTEPSQWSTSFDLSALPNRGVGVEEVVAYSRSPRDGSIENVYGVPITVTP